nr:beta-ketoacyl synthase N-terminal-like domain-containing protein [Caldilineaceae bacterium]
MNTNGYSPSANPSRRVVITGVGLITPLGHSLQESWDQMAAGKSGTGPIIHWDATDFPTQISARVNDWDAGVYMDRKEARRTSRGTQFAYKAAQDAVAMAGLALEQEDRRRIGVEIGLAFGGWDIVEEESAKLTEGGPRRFNPANGTAALISGTPTFVAIKLGVTGPTNSQVTACATGITSIGEAARRLQRGDADADVMSRTGSRGTRKRRTKGS